MADLELVAVLERDRHLADHGHHLIDLDGLALALLVDVGERAALHPLAHDHQVRRRAGAGVVDDGLGAEDVEHRDDAPVVDRGSAAGSRLRGGGARVVGRDQSKRYGALQGRVEALPQLDGTGLRDQHVEEVAAYPPIAHPSRVRVSSAALPDERRRTLRRTRLTTSPTSWMRIAQAAAR